MGLTLGSIHVKIRNKEKSDLKEIKCNLSLKGKDYLILPVLSRLCVLH